MIDTGDGRVIKEYKHPTAWFTPTWHSATNSLFTRYTASATGGGGGGTSGGCNISSISWPQSIQKYGKGQQIFVLTNIIV
ncbi:MAG: hypothetical protein ACJ71X_06455 [Nitrososphaeraceae archaeon]